MSIVDVHGQPLLSRKAGHAIATVRRGKPLPGKHVQLYVACVCSAVLATAARPERMDCWRYGTVNQCRVLDGPCWKYREHRSASGRVTSVTFTPGLQWRGHFATETTWGADTDDA